MDDRSKTGPDSPFSEALGHTPAQTARDAERTLDSPDRDEVTTANREGPRQGRRKGPTPAVVDRALGNPPD